MNHRKDGYVPRDLQGQYGKQKRLDEGVVTIAEQKRASAERDCT